METVVGKISHYFPKAGVAVIVLEEQLKIGDRIHLRGPHEDFHQTVTSMEIDHQRITEAGKGQDIGIKVDRRVHEGDIVYMET